MRNFWLVSPCQARLEAYWDDARGQVKLRFTKNLNPSSDSHNFCCNNNDESGGLTGSTKWPEDGDAFDEEPDDKECEENDDTSCDTEGPENPQEEASGNQEFCDFTAPNGYHSQT